MIRALVVALCVAGIAACERPPTGAPAEAVQPPQRQPAEMEKFFVEWLQQHGEKAVVADSRGVGIEGNTTRLRGALYGVKKHPQGGTTAELEFRITLPSGDEIVEYLPGLGDSQEEATKHALVNFVLTTFHPVYKAFMNPDDPHQSVHKIRAGNREREMIQGDLFVRGEKDGGEGLKTMSDRIREVLSLEQFDARPRWIKVVYAQSKKKPMTVSVTLDNQEDPGLAARVKALPWPAREGFYMAKQFLVIK